MNTKQKPMRSVWQSLLWKEWHEHKWKLLGLIALVLMLAMMLWPERPVLLPMAVTTTFFSYSILAGLFLGMHTAAGENGRGTMPFLQTLPVAMRKPAAARLLMSWISVVVPMLVVIGLTYAYLSWHNFTLASVASKWNWSEFELIFNIWGFENWLLGLGLSGVLCVSSLLLWMAAAGVNRSDEIRAAAAGFLTMAGVWLGLGLLDYWADKWRLPGQEYGIVLVDAAPGGLATAHRHIESWGSALPFIISALVGHAGLLAWYLRRFGRKAVRPARTLDGRVKATKSDWLAPPRRSQLTAIIWKQVHETGPLALMAAAAVLVMASLGFWMDRANTFQSSFTEVLASLTLFVGFLVTVVTGQGVFLEDLKPKVGIFWRSRPINTTQWFFVKFFTGLTVLVVTFGALLLVALAFDKDGQWLLAPDHLGEQIASMAIGALFFLLIYTLSMASYCLGRQPIISVVAALGIIFCGSWAFGTMFDQYYPHWSVGLATLLVAQIAATVVAWLAVRNNWGWHR